jgi:hypothetical protein
MRNTESALWTYLKRGMGKTWSACRHEDTASVGVPDVSYACGGHHGWIELKVVHKWPRTGVVLGKKLTAIQRRWLKERGEHGQGGTWLMLKIETDYVLIDASFITTDAAGQALTRSNAKRFADAFWEKEIGWPLLAMLLSRHR